MLRKSCQHCIEILQCVASSHRPIPHNFLVCFAVILWVICYCPEPFNTASTAKHPEKIHWYFQYFLHITGGMRVFLYLKSIIKNTPNMIFNAKNIWCSNVFKCRSCLRNFNLLKLNVLLEELCGSFSLLLKSELCITKLRAIIEFPRHKIEWWYRKWV